MTLMQTIYDMLRFQLSGLSFLFILLPLMLLVYYLFPPRMRPAVLLAESLLLYRFGELGSLSVMLLSVLADYLLLRLMESVDQSESRRRLCFWVALGKNLLLLVWFGALVRMRTLPVPIGLPVYTLSALNCLLGVYRRELPYERNIIRFALYCCFFPTLFAGPMYPYREYLEQLEAARLQTNRLLAGAGQLIQGAFKTAVFGGGLYSLSQAAAPLDTALAAWLCVFSFAFAFYYMLSGLSDMAQGIGAMFGLTLPRGFYYPYQSRSVEDFSERFHITVGDFLRDLVRFVQGGGRTRTGEIAGVLIVCSLMGLWFGFRLNYLLWGLYLGLFIVMERYVYPRLLENMPTLFSRAATLCVILASFTIFMGNTPAESVGLVSAMFSFEGMVDDKVLYLLTSNWLLLVLSCFFATNIVNLVVVKLRRVAPGPAAAVFGIIDLGILFIYLALNL